MNNKGARLIALEELAEAIQRLPFGEHPGLPWCIESFPALHKALKNVEALKKENTMINIKRYALYTGYNQDGTNDPNEGHLSFYSSSDNLEDLKANVQGLLQAQVDWDWWHIVDRVSESIILNSDNDSL